MAHVWQVRLHSVLQHTPPVQTPSMQSVLATQRSPGAASCTPNPVTVSGTGTGWALVASTTSMRVASSPGVFGASAMVSSQPA